jgi:2-polyprenyl-3-methyl-5-hydroxy-6-metoxy-1,4-benzoquinol methylase
MNIKNLLNKLIPYDPYKQRSKFALSFIGKNKVILDVGCADGIFAKSFREKNNIVYGIDIDKNLIKSAKNNCDKVFCCDIRKGLPFKDNMFDVVFAGEFIEHLNESEGKIFLKECKRVLKMRGMLILTTPNTSCMLRLNPYDKPEHKKCYSPKELDKLLKNTGFVLKARKGLGAISSIIGNWLPFLSLYGTYGVVGEKVASKNTPLRKI